MTLGFSVIVPTYRRPNALASCLEALTRLDHPRDRLEVIVVEDGGPTSAFEGLRSRDFGNLRVRWLAQPRRGPAAARNFGARDARMPFLAFTDDDCRPRPDWLSVFAAHRDLSTGSVLGGHTENALTGNVYSSASQALVTYITGFGQLLGSPFFASSNVCLSRKMFESLGGFDETFPRAGGEDREFSDRCATRDIPMEYEPAAVIDHFHPLTIGRFWHQHFSYGCGAYQYHRIRSARQGSTPIRHVISTTLTVGLRFYWGLVSYPFRAGDPRPLRTSLLLVLAQLPNALGFFAEKIRLSADEPARNRDR